MQSSLFFISPFFFFNDTATTEIYTLSLHDALPISPPVQAPAYQRAAAHGADPRPEDRKSTRLNSSHVSISYAVFCLKKKKFGLSHMLCLYQMMRFSSAERDRFGF